MLTFAQPTSSPNLIKLLYAAPDYLGLTFTSVLPKVALDALARAKREANLAGCARAFTFPGTGVEVLLDGGGTTRFAYRWIHKQVEWSCTASAYKPGDNLRATAKSQALFGNEFKRVLLDILDFVPGIGGRLLSHSLNRFDFAVDVLAPGFHPEMSNFVTHPRATRTTYQPNQAPPSRAKITARGQNVETLTIGSPDTYETTIYAKALDARRRQQWHIFDIWGLPRPGRLPPVFRVELRFFREKLRQSGVRTLDDLECNARPMLEALVQNVRYQGSGQADTNPSRRKNHPLWDCVTEHVRTAELLAPLAGLAPSELSRIKVGDQFEAAFKMALSYTAKAQTVRKLSDADFLALFVKRFLDPSFIVHRTRAEASYARDVAAGVLPHSHHRPTYSSQADEP